MRELATELRPRIDLDENLQHVLTEPAWNAILTPEDRRGLTPMFWSNISPYGEVRLDMNTRLNIPTAA